MKNKRLAVRAALVALSLLVTGTAVSASPDTAPFQAAVDLYQSEHYNESLRLFAKIAEDKKLSQEDQIYANLGAGSAAYQNSHIAIALKHYNKADLISKKIKDFDPRLHAEIVADLADTYYEQEKYAKSIEYFKKALELSHNKKDYQEVYMRSLEGLGACYYKDKRVKESLPIYEEMAWRDRHLYGPLSTQYGWSLRVLQDPYHDLHQDDKAKVCFERSVWNFRLADRDRLVKELEGHSKLSKADLIERVTERTVGIGTPKPEPELKASYTGETTPPEPIVAHKSEHKAGQLHSEVPWQRRRIIMHQAAAMQWVNPEAKPTAIVVCIPGFGLHRTSFSALGSKLSEQGMIVYAYDVRGFGAFATMKARDRIDLAKTLDDLKASLIAIRRDNPGLPIFVLGESMGGSIALQLTSQNPDLVDGLIAAVPSSKRYRQWKLTSKVGLSILTGSKEPINAAPNVVNRATTDPALKQEWKDDPESRFTATPEEFLAVSKFLSHNQASAAKISKTPVIMYQGVHDLLIRPEGTISLFRRIGTLDKDLSLIGRSQHLLFEQGQFNTNLLNSLSDWIKNHSQPGTASTPQ